MQRQPGRKCTIHWLRNLLCGILIGAGAILPGLSGGVLAVIFGIYRPFMELLTHPLTALPKYGLWLIPIAVGWCAGFLAFARGIAVALDGSGTVTTWLFIGLIAGTVPQLLRESGRQGSSSRAWLCFAICALPAFALLCFVRYAGTVSVVPNGWWYTFCGVLWGMGAVIPGLTSSSILMGLGLYQPVLDGLARLDFSVLSAALPGMLLAIVLLARMMDRLLRSLYSEVFHGILGIVAASTLAIIPTAYQGGREVLLSVLCCAGGFLLAFALARLEPNTQTGRK